MSSLEKFKTLGLSDDIIAALEKKGFTTPTQIQEKTIPLLLSTPCSIIGKAQTGTGKTAAFGLPIIQLLDGKKAGIQALILTPTRELTLQVCRELNSFKGVKPLNIIPVYGGQPIYKQVADLKKANIVVGTPGRLIDHIKNKKMSLKQLEFFVLDEADEMLNAGFIDEIEFIFSQTPSNKKTLLFSATMPKAIRNLASQYMSDHVSVETDALTSTKPLTDQTYVEVPESHKCNALCRIIDMEKSFYGLVFCRTKLNVDSLAEQMVDRGYKAEALHGDLSQHQRERVLYKFRKKHCNILVVTDVASRGLDIHNLTHVINIALPQDSESYVHRIGRTGRAGKPGTAITFITPSEHRKLERIRHATKSDIRKAALPSVSDIISNNKQRIKTEFGAAINNGIGKEYMELAEELLQENDPALAVAGMLKMRFTTEMEGRNHPEIVTASRKKNRNSGYPPSKNFQRRPKNKHGAGGNRQGFRRKAPGR